MAPYDIIGNVVLMKFDRKTKAKEKKKIGLKFLKEHPSVNSVLEKSGKIKGRLRTPMTKWVAGDKNKEVLYRENGCAFRFNVDSCYFSPRLASDRKEVAEKVKAGERVLVMFSGVGVYGVVIAKLSKAKEVVCVELGKEPSKYALENVKLNKLMDRVKIVQGDVRKVIGKGGLNLKGNLVKKGGLNLKGNLVPLRFDRIMMARPNLKDSFLDFAFSVLKKGGEISYHGFYPVEDVEEKKVLNELIESEAKKAGRKVKILGIKRAGDIGVRKFRYRADFIAD